VSEESQTTPTEAPTQPKSGREAREATDVDNSAFTISQLLKGVALLMAVASMAATILTAVASWLPGQLTGPRATPTASAPPTEIQALQRQVGELSLRVDELKVLVASWPPVPTAGAPSPEVASLQMDLDSVDERLDAIESAILLDPAGALDLARLQMELEALDERQADSMEAIDREVTRVYDFNKWFILLMFTMAATLVAVAVNIYRGQGVAS
jgi:hypothetical protein